MSRNVVAKFLRSVLKLVFTFGSWWLVVSSIWGKDITVGMFERLFKIIMGLAFLALFTYYAAIFTSAYDSKLLRVLAVLVSGGASIGISNLIYTFVVRKILALMGMYFGFIVVLFATGNIYIIAYFLWSMACIKLGGKTDNELREQLKEGTLFKGKGRPTLMDRGIMMELDRRDIYYDE